MSIFLGGLAFLFLAAALASALRRRMRRHEKGGIIEVAEPPPEI